MIARSINFSLFIMFLLFAAVQYNDPDPAIWMVVYSYTAVVCLLAGLNRYYPLPTIIVSVLSLVWFLTLAASIFIAYREYGAGSLFSFSMVKDKEVEEARESLGLLIVSFVLLWKYFEGKKHLALVKS